jgi:hypothetical protein
MNHYSVITVATVSKKYKIKAKSKEDARKKYYCGEWYLSDELNIHDEIIDKIEEENVK